MKDYQTWQRWETEFDGQPISMELKTLTRKSMLKLFPLMSEFQNLEETPESMGKMLDLVDKGAAAIMDHVRMIDGFTVDGERPSIGAIAQETAFTQLIIRIMTRLVEISIIERPDEKN